jgi:asparagine synthase (glutamine-hydrolysing)
MCGICGIINKNDQPVPHGEIKMINDLIQHRGPDGEGYYFGENFAFGHRRLSIIDLSEKGKQPMVYSDKYIITYNGEIYNYLELRQELKTLGYSFDSESDTEVILASYDHFGKDCVRKFNGMWSFALFDRAKNIIFCSRDRFGVKPFYYTEIGGKFIFGSEIKVPLSFYSKRYANLPLLIDFLVAGMDDHTNETFYKNIFKLQQSHNLVYNLNNHSFTIEKYYDLRINPDLSKLSEPDSINHYLYLLKDSVKLRLRSDVKVGTCLSGGLDSSSVASIGASYYNSDSQHKFTAITAKSTEAATDESYYAGLVSEKANLNWHTLMPTGKDFYENLDKIISVQEEPFGSPSVFMQFKVFEKAKELGCIVMLDGQGGDETLLGYERYYPAYLISLGLLKGFSSFFNSFNNSRLSWLELFSYLFYFTNPRLRLQRLRKKFSFIKKSYFGLINSTCLIESAKSYHDIVMLQKLELLNMQLPHLLKYEDRNSMYHSIESRLPFIDFRLVETAVSLNNSFKIKDGWTKFILRKATENLIPSEITWRKNKLGFNAPEKTWLEEINDLMIKQISGSRILYEISDRNYLMKNFKRMNPRVQWRLYNIARWEQIFNVSLG